MHTHFGALAFVATGLYIALWLTLWRLIAAHLASSSNPTARNFGSAMAFQG